MFIVVFLWCVITSVGAAAAVSLSLLFLSDYLWVCYVWFAGLSGRSAVVILWWYFRTTMAQLISVAGTSRETLYERCLLCFVTKLNYNQQTLNNVQQLRYLPPGVLIDIYVLVSFKRVEFFHFYQFCGIFVKSQELNYLEYHLGNSCFFCGFYTIFFVNYS